MARTGLPLRRPKMGAAGISDQRRRDSPLWQPLDSPGRDPCDLCCLDRIHTLKESRRSLKHFGIHKPLSAPRVVVEMMADLKSVADLSGIDAILPWPGLDELLSEDWERINLG